MEGILNLENWRKFGNDWTESSREELRIGFIDKVDDYIVNQYYIYCITDNCNIGYPIKYCPVCGAKLE